MKSAKRQFALALFLSPRLLALQICLAGENSKPIVDVRVDAPYRQIESSFGDEWAPAWGGDDVLYTGNDDGTSFGGIESNAITFGKLEGSDPYSLKGATINGMADFREPLIFGPAAAGWQTLETYRVGRVRYRFMACDGQMNSSDSSCLASSADEGKTWTRVTAPGKSLAHGARFGAPSFISYGPTEIVFGGKLGEYVYASSFAGVMNGRDSYWVGRVSAAKLAASNPADWSFQQPNGSWGSLEAAAQLPNTSYLGLDGANWKMTSTYSVDGVLYMFVTRCVYPRQSTDPKHRHVWQNASVIKSTDGGKTWTRSAADNYANPMFPGKRFGTPYFVWYGKDGAASVDHADKYVYAVSNNGYFENGDNYVLGRVPRSKLPNLTAADWSFFKNGDGMRDGNWTPTLDSAEPVLTIPGRAGMTGMTYMEGLRRYIMVAWHYHKDNFYQAIVDRDLGTVLEFLEAPKPWGPWTSFKTLDTGKLGWYAPVVGQRFQKTADSATVTAILYSTGFYTKPEGGVDYELYKLNYMPITLSTKPLEHKDPTFVGTR